MVNVQPVILCGGSGTRLWPVSRADFPKQFIGLFGAESLFQMTVQRLRNISALKPVIVSNESHRFLILDQLRGIGVEPASILLEPVPRNTAPALALAVCYSLENGDDPVLLVSPSDQMVVDNQAFSSTLGKAIKLAESGSITLLGIMPERPETGFGYIKIKKGDVDGVVEKFVEKPDRATAEQYLKDGCYFWNSGIFIMRASVWQQALEKFRPDIASSVNNAWEERQNDSVFVRPGKERFAASSTESIDYAVIENCAGVFDVRMVPLAAGWSDLGSWESAWHKSTKDEAGNACAGDCIIKDSTDVFVHSSGRLVGVVGVSNIAVVETPDAVLVIDKARSQEVKQIIAELDKKKRSEHLQHRKVYRPWGWYDNIDEGKNFKVKRIMVRPGASLSLQKHNMRAEHWVVVSGTAEVTCGEKKITLHENQSTYIPLGEVHRLSNPADRPLEIIEVQSGAYLGEDDIIRLEDIYGRGNN